MLPDGKRRSGSADEYFFCIRRGVLRRRQKTIQRIFWRCITIKPKARLERKENAIDVQEFRIVALETIDSTQWEYFSKHLLDDYDFISKHEGNLHVEQDGVTNALLVLNAKTGEGILVNSEGSAYARYSA